MIHINWFAVTIIFIWFFAALGARWTKETHPFGAALVITLLMGYGYLLIHH